jgi:aspartyl-tRNA(Asn)/glutamyl-tRNA(Gln) amidotransferase subunit A
MQMVRRRFLHLAGAATALLASPYVVQAQQQAPRTGASPPRSARDRLEEALARIADPNGEGSRACLTIYAQAARAAADAADARARAGISLGPLDGAIVSVKDLFDVAGEPTRAGSKVLADAPPAATDAPVLRRLRAAGAVIVAKTNMTEFAFSGIGANPHYGTPGNPADRTRVPGGSSSGAVVAVADGMCEIAIGSDTGGSTRVPAALCGVVGYKPTKSRVPTEGAFPLSFTLDSIGPIARSVAACAAADAVMAGDDPWTLEPVPLQGLRLGIPQGLPLRGLDQTVTAQFSDATKELGRTGVRLSDELLALLDDMVRVNSKATFAVAESWSIHRERLATRAADYDPSSAPASKRGAPCPPPTTWPCCATGRPWCARWMRASPISTRWYCRRRRSSLRRSPKPRAAKASPPRMRWSCAIPRSPISSISARSPFRCRAPRWRAKRAASAANP